MPFSAGFFRTNPPHVRIACMAGFRTAFRFALRQFRRSPAFTGAALGCLALGIGATSAIFTVVNAVVLRPLPYRDSARLVRLYTEWPTWTGGGMWRFWTSPPEFADLRRDNQVFETLDAWQPGGANLSPSGRDPVRVNIALVSGTLLGTLGVAPHRGRILTPADDAEGAPVAVVLSYGLWQGAFAGEENVVGREVVLNGNKAAIAGVMPRGFEFPPGEPEPAELWASLQLSARDMQRFGNHRLSVLGRLKPGRTLAHASADLDRLEREYAKYSGRHRLNPANHTLAAFPLLEETVGNVRPALLVMLGATLLVLLIACGNVANLLLARAQTRQREVALRLTLGASPAVLLRQFLIEGVLLALAGGALGVALGAVLLRVIVAAGADSIPRASEIWLDLTVVAVALGASLATGIVFALAPLAQTIRSRLFATLKSAGGRTTATREAHWLRAGLVAGEIALALALLAGASLLIDNFRRLTLTDPGFRAERILSMRVALPQQNYPDGAPARRFWTLAAERLAQSSGVAGIALLADLPPQRPINANDTYIEGLVPVPGGPIHNVDYWNAVSPGTFEMLGVPLIEGRFIQARDGEGAPPVLVVNQTFARTFYGTQSAIGKRVKPGGRPDDDSPWFTIVGVVADLKNAGLDRPAGTELFASFAQAPRRSAAILVKARGGDPWNVLGAVREQLRAIDPALPLSQVRPLEDAISAARARPGFLALLLSLFAGVALGLAATGIFSVMMYSVAQRTGEFGVRMALGAEARQVVALVLRQGMMLVAAGIAAGAVAIAVLFRLARGYLAGLAEPHWVPLAAALAVLVAATLAACWLPARRATRVDPVIALRAD
jgi:putative ABC transport system permease protein